MIAFLEELKSKEAFYPIYSGDLFWASKLLG
jgi:hypothetical protein